MMQSHNNIQGSPPYPPRPYGYNPTPPYGHPSTASDYQQITSLIATVATLQQMVKDVQGELRTTKTRLQASESNAVKLQDSITEQAVESEFLRKRVRDSEETIKVLEIFKIKALGTQTKNSDIAINALRKQITASDSAIASLRSRASVSESANKFFSKKISEYDIVSKSLETRASKSENATKASLKDLRCSVLKQQGTLADTNACLRKSKNRLRILASSTRTEATRLEKSVLKLTVRSKELEQNLDDIEYTVTEQGEGIDKVNNRIRAYEEGEIINAAFTEAISDATANGLMQITDAISESVINIDDMAQDLIEEIRRRSTSEQILIDEVSKQAYNDAIIGWQKLRNYCTKAETMANTLSAAASDSMDAITQHVASQQAFIVRVSTTCIDDLTTRTNGIKTRLKTIDDIETCIDDLKAEFDNRLEAMDTRIDRQNSSTPEFSINRFGTVNAKSSSLIRNE